MEKCWRIFSDADAIQRIIRDSAPECFFGLPNRIHIRETDINDVYIYLFQYNKRAPFVFAYIYDRVKKITIASDCLYAKNNQEVCLIRDEAIKASREIRVKKIDEYVNGKPTGGGRTFCICNMAKIGGK